MNEKQSTGNSKSVDFDSDDFFEQLDNEVNSAVVAEKAVQESPKEQITQQSADPSSGNMDYEKRYKDSSREALKMRETLNRYEPFLPVLDAMKEDPGMVDTVRTYLESKQSPPKNVAEALKLDEDFIYDPDEAIQNPDSQSARVFTHMVDNVVQTRLGEAQKRQAQQIAQAQRGEQLSKEKDEFVERHSMTNEDFEAFMTEADQRRLTLEDVFHIMNRDKAAKNIDQNARQDVMKQMKNAQSIPSSVSGASSAGDKSADQQMYEMLMNIDSDVDNMFE
ncbi:MAG: hypothetical protein H8D23_17955 [Candidatus Brocadiales bacterium]|nr:hypothetical protein [Candidatus Brocadiales bacterium]